MMLYTSKRYILTFFSIGRDSEKRSVYLTESLLSLKRATEMDTRSWQGFYQLALQQAIMGDMANAANAVQRAIKLRGDFIPSWHLLALIQSSRQFHALPKSLQIIQAGLAYHMNMVDNFDNEEILMNLTLDTEEGQEFFDRAEAFIKLRMSQAQLLEILEGSEAVLKVYPDLFDMYAKLSKKMNLPIVQAPPELMVPRKSSLHDSSVKSRPRSRTGSSSVHSNSSFFDDNESLDSHDSSAQQQEQPSRSASAVSATTTTATATATAAPLLKVDEGEEEEEEEEEDEYFMPDNHAKSRKKSKANLSQLMDDPLMSLGGGYNSKKKEKKEKKEKVRRSTFLSLKPSFRSNSGHSTKKGKSDPEPIVAAVPAENVKDNNNMEIGSTFTRQSSMKSASTSALLQQQQQQSSTYSSLLNKQESTSNLTTTVQQQQKNLEKNAYFNERQSRWQEILVSIWIMTSATYARSQRFEDAYKAIGEADQLTYGLNADVWNQLGLIIVLEGNSSNKKKSTATALGDYQDRAIEAFKRALSIDPEHVPTHISLSSLYLSIEQFELAEQLLERSTKGLGWNKTEAW